MSHDEHFLTPPSGHPQNPVGYPGAINIQITPYQPLNPVVNQHVVGTATSTPPTDNPRNNATNSVSLNPLHRPESLNHRRSHSRRKFDKAIKLAPLSEELLQKVSSPDVSKWKPRDAELWLEHVFSGASAELFNRYLHFFKQFGVQGIDLLNLSEDTYADMGVTDSIHLNRIRESSEQLLRHQEKLERDNEDRENTARADFLYTKTKAEYEEKMAQRTDGLPLTLPANMQVWKLIDVFAFFKRPGNEHLEKVFLKTLILSEIDGEKLIRLADPNTRLENRDVSVKNIYSQNEDHVVMRLIGLNAEAIDIKRLKDVINRYRKRQEENVAAARQSAKNELWKNLGSYDPKKLVVQEQIGKGAFGCVYRALYEKKKVVMKILIAKDQSSNRGGQKVDDSQSSNLADDLEYEATMLLKAETTGVVKLLALDRNRDPPCMITEYLPNKTVEYEYKLAEEKNDPESIFHANNEHNIGNNVSNPVLLQMVRIARDVAGALSRIHEIGIVHLDIAARNILLDLKKRPKIADFGCAAMEADMIKMYELRRVYSHEDLDIEELTKKDQDFPRKNRMYSMKRPIKWMPHWVVNNRNMPKIDKHTDVYSFGCFMYELAARSPPHALLPDKDVEDYKRVKPYNPTIPVDIDQRYTSIVQSCWEDYNNQPTMKDIAARLSELHSELATESVSETIQNDQGYWEFREIKPRMDIFRSKSLYSYSQSKSTTSSSSTTPPPPKAKSPLKEASLPSEKVSGRINLNFAHVDLSDAPPKLVEYELEGYDESRLQSALHSAFCLRDHQSIALTMLCINIENQEEQIMMITKCLEYIQLLAEDQHGSTDEDEAFEWLCRSILMIVKDASLTSKAIEQQYLGRLVGDALLALSSLLANKSLAEVSIEGTASLESELCSIVFDALRKFSRDETVTEKVAIAVASFCGLSQLIVKKLHADGTVLALLDALNVYAGNLQMALKLVKALSCFPIQCLIDCVQGEAKMGKGNKVISSSGKASKESTSSKPNATKLEDREGEGVVYVNLFAIVRRCVYSLRRTKLSTTNEKGSDSDQELTLILLQNCLTSLFKMCESGMNDNDTINRLLHCVVAEDIEVLVEIMQMFPDYFRMQEGAIGLLAHILSTGKAIPVTARELTSSAKTETSLSVKDKAFLLPKLPAEQRLVKYLELDQTLALLLTAMETFKVNNRIAIGIATKSDAHKPTGIYSNDAYYQTSTTKRTVSTMTISKIRSLASDGDGGGDEKNDFYDDDDFDMDETGEPITAAALQRCVAIIIGIACNSRKLGKQVQENLVRTRYNENILSAFKTFARDVSLVRFGCQALFYTARRHDKHQQKLQHLYIFKHLISALLRHQSFPEVVEAVVCAFMGLLEPPEDVKVLPRDILENIRYTLGLETITKGGNVEEEGGASNVEQFKQLRIAENKELNHRKRNFVGYSAATFLVANNQILTVQLGLGISGMSVLQLLAVFVANFEVREECQALVTSFLKLVCGIAFWLPEEAQAWSPDHIFVDLSVLKLNLLNRLFAKVIVNEIVNALKGNTTPTREKEKMGEGVAAIEEYGRPLSLIEYILRAMNMHKLSMNVISSSLTLFTAIFRSSLEEDDAIIGGEVTAYQDEGSLISQHRQSLFSSLVPFCCFACFRREDNPILIRYSLWILIIFLAEKQPELENPTETNGVDTTGKMTGMRDLKHQSKTIASQIAAQLSIDGLTEWAIIVATTFHDYYSLQILCSHFIIWMEYHNMLDSKSYQQLEEIITIAKRNISTPITSFRSLDEEGHDTYLLGESIEVFGDLSIVSQRLLRIIESQLPLSHYSTINDNQYNDRISSTQLQGNSEKPHLGFEKANEDQLFEEIAKELDVQLRFVRTVSANIKEWTTRNALDWFKEIFSGDSEETQRYLKKFQQSGITGKDLLIMEEKEFVQQLGIDLANHRKRFSLHLQKLQNYHEKHVTERLYYEMEMLYQERLLLEVRGSSPYQLPLSISTWKTFDIFVFLKLSGNEHLEKFLKPVALSELTGEQLLLISLPETEVKRKDPSSPISDNAAHPEEPKPPHAKIEVPTTNPDSSKKQNVIYLVGLEEDAEIEKLKVAIRNQKNTMEKRMQQEKQEAMNRLWKTLGAFDRKKLTILELLGQGSFGNVYRAQYEKKKVVVKQLMGSVMHRSKEQLVEDLKYEAMMLLEAATVGVIKLIAIDADNDPPRMVIEYLPNNTLEHEYQLAKLNDDSSIFHPENEFNVLEKETNGVYNPVLLQMVRIARDVAGALARIHEKGIVHLDIAARNILLDLKKRPKIADFGCAAMEADMIEMYEFFHSKAPMDVNVKARCENDEEFSRKYEMYSRQRPVRWMPYWAVEDTWSPRIDRSADVYAFGCLMYELTVQGIPHPDDSDEQVLKLKKDQRINPDSPRNIDHRYSAIMTSCWENYDRQPSMHTIALQLASLHTTVATENVIRDSFYSELRQVIRFSGHKVAMNFPEMLPVATSPTNPWREERGKKDYLDATHRIFFSFDKTEFVIAVSKRQQLQHDGVPDDVLVNGLHCAHRFRDHQFIAFILQNILIKENDVIHSVEIICLCLELLEHLADDQHGSTNEEGTYQWLCAVIIEVMHRATGVITAATASTEGLLEDNNYGARITGSTLSTLGALLQNKSLPEHNLATEEQGFELQLCGIIFQAIRNYREDDFVAEKVAVAIFSFSGLSQVMVNKLHMGGAVGGLLEMLRYHHEKFEVAIDIVRALSCFPIQCLLEPMSILDSTASAGEESANAQSQKLQDQNTISKSNSKPIVTSTFKGRKAAAIEKRLNKANQAVAVSPSASNKSEKNSAKSTVKSETWGQVFTEIFSFVKVCVKELQESRKLRTMRTAMIEEGNDDEEDRDVEKEKEDDDDELTVLLLETCLTSLFRICESGVNDTDLINKVLHIAKEDAISCLITCLQLFPQSFRIQEGSIGLLAHIVNTGIPVYIRDRSYRCIQTIYAPFPAESRLSYLLVQDPELRLIVNAMENFKVNDQIATGIREKEPDYVSDTSVSRSVYHTNTTAATMTAASRTKATKTSVLNFSSFITPAAASGMDDNVSNQQQSVADEADELPFTIDETGDQITAAALQRSAAIILGIACNSRKEGKQMQDRLERSRYNETILLAFRNFRRDVSLIRFGCHALAFTCRRHFKHQQMLQKLSIQRHLYQALDRHKAIWEVVEAVICAVTGILEPPEDITEVSTDIINQVYKSMSVTMEVTISPETKQKIAQLTEKAIAEKKFTYVGYWLAKELTKPLGKTSLLQQLAIMVVQFQINEECHLVVRSFLLLLCCIGFWLPEKMEEWHSGPKKFINLSLALNSNSRFKQQFFQMMSNANNVKLLSHFGHQNSSTPVTSSAKASAEDRRTTAFEVLTASPPTPPSASLSALSNPNNAMASYDINVVQFALLSLCWHRRNSDVLAAGLAIITATIRKSLPKHYQLGDEIADYAFPNREISQHRQTAMNTDLLRLCMEAAALQEDHPILIRYSLWLLLLFICQRNENPNDATDATLIASETSIGGCLEWAITVAKKYVDFYSLQVLATWFMYWMEYHGRFDNKDKDRLQEIKEVVEGNLKAMTTATTNSTFRPLVDEGTDTYLVGVTNKTFGDLKTSSQKLLSRINDHLSGNVSSIRQRGKAGVTDAHDYRLWEAAMERSKPGIHLFQPKKIVFNRPRQVIPTTPGQKKYFLYEIDVSWSDVKRWAIERRFTDCLQLKESLMWELRHLDCNIPSNDLIKPTLGGVFEKALSPTSFLEKRRVLLQQWINELTNHRVIRHSEKFRTFANATINTDGCLYAKRLPDLNVIGAASSIIALHYCSIHRLLFIVCIVNSNQGKVLVYSFGQNINTSNNASQGMSWKYLAQEFHFCGQQEFTEPVLCLTYEPSRRGVIVGLTSGPVVVFFLTNDNKEFYYRTELNSHYSPVVAVTVDTTLPNAHYCISVGQAGSITSLNLSSGRISSQGTCPAGTKIYSLCYDPYQSVAFCGTDQAKIIVFDLKQTPAVELHCLNICDAMDSTLYQPQDAVGSVLSLAYDSKRRILYASLRHRIFRWRIFSGQGQNYHAVKENYQFLSSQAVLSLIPSAIVKSISLINDGQFLLVGEDGGGITIFDLFQPVLDTSRLGTLGGGSSSQAISWKDAVMMGTSTMLAWLHKHAVDTSVATTRDDVLHLIAEANNLSDDDVIGVLIPPQVKNEAFIAWSTLNRPDIPTGTSGPPFNSAGTVQSMAVISSHEYVLCGGKDGIVSITSLEEFILPASTPNISLSLEKPEEIVDILTDCRSVALKSRLIVNLKGKELL